MSLFAQMTMGAALSHLDDMPHSNQKVKESNAFHKNLDQQT
jgi:hypothetical protein